jgi:hypothetical protein
MGDDRLSHETHAILARADDAIACARQLLDERQQMIRQAQRYRFLHRTLRDTQQATLLAALYTDP